MTLEKDVSSATETLYDARGRVTASVLKGDGTEKWRTTTTYGPDWQAVVPPQGGTATLAVSDARGRVVERRDYKDRTPGIGDAATLYDKHTYVYDRAGKLAKITDNSGRNNWTYSYDLQGRQTQATDPDKGKTTTIYGTDGRPQSSTDARGITLATTYDELGRKTSLRKDTVTGTKLAAWSYDTATGGKGLPATTIRYDGTTAYTSTVIGYDTGGRPTGTKVTVPSVTGEEELAGTYTVSGTSTPVSGMPATTAYSTTNAKAATALPAETVTNDYGAQDNLNIVESSLGDVYLAGARYTPFGELAKTTHGNINTVITNTVQYDNLTRRVENTATERDRSGPSVLSDSTYTYDPAGNITRINDKQNDATVTDDQCFTYDWARRMTEAWTSGDSCTTKPVNGAGTPDLGSVDPYWTSWTFTDTGQRATEKQHKAGPVTADTLRTHAYPTGTTAGHELLKVTATGGSPGTDTFTYDQTGNLRTKDTAATAAQTMTWDDEGKLASSTVGSATTSFLYDTAGTRILKREPATTTLYLPGGQELILTKATNTVTGNRYYTFPGGSAIRSSSDGLVRFLIADHHGTNTLSISASTLAYNRRKSLPYGAQRGTAPFSWPGQKGFVGGDIDSTTGFTHIGARDYDPTTGQFISVDPLLSTDLPQSLNGYNYANNSPITSSDPTGMREMCSAYGNSCTPTPPPPCGAPCAPPKNLGTNGGSSGSPGTGGSTPVGSTTGTGDVASKKFFLGAPLTSVQYDAMTKQGYQGSQNYTADEAKEWTAILGCVEDGSKIEACRKQSDAKKNATEIEVFINKHKDGISITNQLAGDTATLGLFTAAGCTAWGNLPCVGAAASVTKWSFTAKAATRVPLVINACGAFSEGNTGCTEQSIGLVSDLISVGTGFVGEGVIAGYIADRIVVGLGFRGQWR
ncbi:RHS repeat-associated core domain-containing protein [Streptomyces sp. NPDC051563]|uniref:RHS repeat-associated core domain-containing protein n=1 Tax=Streptomyces sp. NPDC051563 TaxID=3365659 RepID=UPI00378DD130